MKDKINKTIQTLKKGGIIIYPSESCYSFGCSAFNKRAIEKIHKIKKDEKNKPYSILISNINQIKEIAKLNPTAKKLVKNIFPAQLNLIVEKNSKKNIYFSKDNAISFRIPAHKVPFQLCKILKLPIITTSVNIHGKPSLYNIKEIRKQFESKVDYILDAGNLDKNIPVSTIYDTRTNKIIRKGPVSLKKINFALKFI